MRFTTLRRGWKKWTKHILPNGGEFNGDESHGTIRKTSPTKQTQGNDVPCNKQKRPRKGLRLPQHRKTIPIQFSCGKTPMVCWFKVEYSREWILLSWLRSPSRVYPWNLLWKRVLEHIPRRVKHVTVDSTTCVVLLMEEFLHHLECRKPCK